MARDRNATPAARERKRRYRERHREKIRAKGRAYAERKRREAGMAARGTPEAAENYRRANLARDLTGPRHPNWKGDEVGYHALHRWVERRKVRTGICSECGAQPEPMGRRRVGTEFANVSGEYRRDLADYVELCVPCHRRQDGNGLIHGTSTGYGHYGCRCDLCRQAQTERAREYKRRKVG